VAATNREGISMQRLWPVSALAALALGTMLFASAAEARLDPAFGDNGVVSVQPPLPAVWQSQGVRQLAAGRDGSSYALFARYRCPSFAINCPPAGSALFRYRDDGTLDPGFGGSGSYDLPEEKASRVLAVDSSGRPLIGQVDGSGRVVVRRLTRSGALDAGFGDAGIATFECGCKADYRTQLVPGPAGSVTVAVSEQIYHPTNRTIETLVRLRADGSVDSSFGQAGRTVVGLPGVESVVASAVSGKGDVYLSRVEAHSGDSGVVRVAANGKVDRRFTKAVRRALRPVRKLSTLDWSVNSVLSRSDGGLDLVGAVNLEHGFIMSLNASGHPVRSFGRKGLRILSPPIVDAARGSEGATVAVSEDFVDGRNFVMRILPGGEIDRSFGVRRIPDSYANLGFSVVSQTRGRAMVLDLGYFECREACAPDPKLIRYLEGPARKRR
jgi:uncharacterized delta-60 repeat protein